MSGLCGSQPVPEALFYFDCFTRVRHVASCVSLEVFAFRNLLTFFVTVASDGVLLVKRSACILCMSSEGRCLGLDAHCFIHLRFFLLGSVNCLS